METYATITPNWQLHIPVSIRKTAGLTSHGRVKIRTQKNKIIITKPKKSILDWAGAFRVKNPIPADKIRDYIDYSDL